MHPSGSSANLTIRRSRNARIASHISPQGEPADLGENLRPVLSFRLVSALVATMGAIGVRAQEPSTALKPLPVVALRRSVDCVSLLSQYPQPPCTPARAQLPPPDAPTPQVATTDPKSLSAQEGHQPKRILWIIPNYRSVSANTQLPPLSITGKFWLATEDTFDYSDFILDGGLAGISMAQRSQPSFGQGGAGYGRYYWHTFVDGGIENYMTEAILPWVTREDPRYYTLGRGGFVKRTGYAVSRLFITRMDSGRNTFNISEIVGAGAAAGIGNTYYPAQSNVWVKTYQRWGTQMALDGVFNVLKEFWPDINRAVFHGKY